MGQSLIGDFTGHICVAQETNRLSGSCHEPPNLLRLLCVCAPAGQEELFA
jgi:hypothetical protein